MSPRAASQLERASRVDLEDVQALVAVGFGHHTEACFLLLRVKEVRLARAWLSQVEIAHAGQFKALPDALVQVALTSAGLRALKVPDEILAGFSEEFLHGMSGDPNRARRLGDEGDNHFSRWQWGSGANVPDVAVLLYARPGALAGLLQTVRAQCRDGFEEIGCLSTAFMGVNEPFGFHDGISQPELDWSRGRPAADVTVLDYDNVSCLGEFLLGYPNEYGLYTPRPLLESTWDPGGLLPRAEESPEKADIGRNGTYLVMRQLKQDVRGFWSALDRYAKGEPDVRDALAAAMVGRTRAGVPLVSLDNPTAVVGSPPPQDLNRFDYRNDVDGVKCPLGAHIRRTNPRNADLPAGSTGLVARLVRTFGLDPDARSRDLVASTRFHRLLRRGREYGTVVPPDQAALQTTGELDTGLHFICLGANIQRQFEFVQSAWVASSKFNGLGCEGDPLLGNRLPDLAGNRNDVFSRPQREGPDCRLTDLPRFVTVVGGAYFFLPGIRALRFMARPGEEPLRKRLMPASLDSNTSRPVPPAATGSAFLNLIANSSFKLLQLERRFDPFVRPPLDALLRDPLARLTTALINWRRSDEGMKLAEERELPGEQELVDSIIATFEQQMRGLWKPGGFERGGNTKTHGIVRAEFIVHEDLPSPFRHGIFAQPRTYRAWVRFSGPGPYITPDIDDVGFMSISIKLLGVPGPKLMEEEKFTQDMTGVSTPTFVTPDVKANAQLQRASLQNAAIFYFANLHRPHLLDGIMQGLWLKTQSSPFEAPYFSCVPYLLGPGQAMQYSVWPKTNRRTPIPRLPLRPPDNYLRNAMVTALKAGEVELDFRVQLQTDPFLMPIENAAVLWPERLSPRVSVATLRIPPQKFDSPAQIDFEKRLSYNPWHCIAEHRPLGNQSRARRRMYLALSTLRHDMNAIPHYEPTGDEVFD